MKKKFENMERRGLPGGPNEMFSYVTGVFSTEGYKSDSPDKNNPANLIASGSITMENVEFPVLGMDNLGNSKMMMPGNNYQFPGDMVLEIPMAQDGNGERSEGLNKIDTSKYNVRVINYPYGSKKFSPGHIESVLIDKDTGEQVNKIPGTDYVGYINRWSTMGGNKPVRKSDYEGKDDVRTVDLDLSEEDIRDYLQQAQMFQPTQRSRFHTQARMDTTRLPLSLTDDNMYEYDFIDSNCATGVCLGLGMDPDSQANSRGGITDPNFVMDNILENYSAAGKVVPGSITGTRTSRFEGLQNLVKRETELDLSGDTINLLTNYINSLDRDQINNAVETILKNPTALKAIKNKGVDRIANRALTDLDAIVSDLLPGGDKPGRGRVQMAKNRLKDLGYDIKDIYDNLPEGTIPAALKALYNERAQFIPQIKGLSDVDSFAEMTGIPINDLEFSMEGVKNIPNYWLNKLGFQKGGSVSWNWKGKTYSGTLIPSMEDENNRYARTKNGKIKTLPKGQKGVEQSSSKRTRADIYKDINRLNQQIRDTDSQLEQFRKNIGTIYQGFQQAGDETLTDEQRQTELDTLLSNSSINPNLFVANTSNPNEGRVIGLDSVPKVTRDWLRSIGGYGCTTYGCGLLRQAGAVTEEGNPFPMISGNSQLNSMIERNEGGLQMRLMDPGFSDLVAGDRIVSNYSTSGGDGDSHTMIFTGEYDDDGSPIVMENSGGWVPGGVSINSLQNIKGYRDTSDPESGLRVTRYNLGRDELQSELDKLKEEYMAADPEPQIQLSELKPASVNITPIEQQLENQVGNITIPINATQRIQPKKQFAGEITNDVLLRQVFAESSLDPNAVSPAGARGLAQFMPNTETELKRLKLVNDNFDPLDPSQARNAQEAYMNYLSERPYLAKGSPEVQLAKVLYAYNRGPNAAKRNLTQLKNSYDIYNSLDWLEGINSESRSYINKILGKDEKFSKEYENILLDSTRADMVKMYKQFGGDVDLKRIYKNFVEGIYENTNNQKRGRDIYDKLNRMYYREAKSAGMSMPNYVMTYIIGNS